MYIFIISLFTYLILFIKVLKKHLHMAQQNLYNRNKRYLKWFIKDIFKSTVYHKSLLLTFAALIIISIFRLNNPIILNIYFFVSCFILYKIFVIEDKKNVQKLPLKVTPRIKRLVCTIGIIFILLTFTFFTKYNINSINLVLLIPQ